MNTRKLIFLITFSFIGLSCICANENPISFIKNRNDINARSLGYHFCKLTVKEEKTFIEKLQDSLSLSTSEEQAIAKIIKSDERVMQLIFSGKASEDPFIREIQEGCFDFLSEEILPQLLEFTQLFSNVDKCHTLAEREEIERSNPDFDFSDYDKHMCNETQLLLRNNAKQIIEKYDDATRHPIKLMYSLGLTDRIAELEQKATSLFYEDADNTHKKEL